MTSTLVSIEDLMCFEISEWDDEELCVKKTCYLTNTTVGDRFVVEIFAKINVQQKKVSFHYFLLWKLPSIHVHLRIYHCLYLLLKGWDSTM